MKETRRLLREALEQRTFARVMPEALLGLPWVLRERHVVPPHVEAALRRVNEFHGRETSSSAQRVAADGPFA